MSDVENEMELLERKLAAKTREIEACVATQQNLGDLSTMESSDRARLRTYVEDLIYECKRRRFDHPGPILTRQ